MHTLLYSNVHLRSQHVSLNKFVFGVLLAANGCPLDLINCTIPYDDLNISTVVIIDVTQYCHVDNCTVKIIKTGDELNIAYHNDQYHLGCTTTTLQLLEVNDNTTSYCEQEYDDNKLSLFLIVANYVLLTIAFALNVLIMNCDNKAEVPIMQGRSPRSGRSGIGRTTFQPLEFAKRSRYSNRAVITLYSNTTVIVIIEHSVYNIILLLHWFSLVDLSHYVHFNCLHITFQ